MTDGMTENSEKVASFVAERLSNSAGRIVEEWVEWVRTRVDNPTVDALPYRALLNHIPPVVEALRHYILSPSYAIREEMIGHLKMHGQIRRDQGYEATDIMAEFDGLSHMIMRSMQHEIAELEVEATHGEVLEVFARLSDGLRAMSFVTLAVYQEAAESRNREMAERLSDFGRAIGHELRNPLNTIALGAQILERLEAVAGSEAGARQTIAIRVAAEHAAGLIDDINVLAMAHSGEAGSRMMTMSKLFEKLRSQLHVQANTRNVELDVPTEVPGVAVEGLVGTLALVNVISNAIKYSDPEKDQRWVKVDARLVNGGESPFVEIKVRDNGIGIPEDMQLRVFQRGFRAHPGHAEGTGLGLAITQELLTERGGRVDIESVESEGTTVTILIRAIDAQSTVRTARGHRPETLMDRSVRMALDPEFPLEKKEE